MAIAVIGKNQLELVGPVVKPYVDDIAKGIEGYHLSDADKAELLIRVLIEMAPEVWESIVLALDAELAEESLANCLTKGSGHRRAAALVVDSAQRAHGQVGEMARRLRKRFPKSSVPPDRPPRYLSRRRRK